MLNVTGGSILIRESAAEPGTPEPWPHWPKPSLLDHRLQSSIGHVSRLSLLECRRVDAAGHVVLLFVVLWEPQLHRIALQ